MDLFTKIHNKRKRRSDDDSYENKRKNNLRSTREQMVYLTVFLLFVIVSIFVDLRGTAQNNEQFQLQENRWILETGEEIDVNNLPEGHHIVTSDLGKKTISGKSLCMKSIDTNFIVYADGEILYTYYPKIPLRFGVSYGMFVHSIAVPDNTRELKIEVDPIFSDTVAGLNEVVIGDSGQYMTELFRRNMVPFGLSSIILILGLIFLVTGLTSAILMRSAGIDFVSFGTTCMMIGFVGFNDTMILQVLTGHPELIRVLTYVCLIFVPFPTLSFFASPPGKSRAWFVSGMLVVCLANFISQLLLTHYGITDYYHLVNISHAVIMLTLIASLWMIVDSIIKKTINSELLRSSIGGLVSCIIGVAIDMFRFHYLQSNGSSVFTSVGVLIFAVLMCTYMINKQKQALKQKNRDTVTLVGEIAEAFAKVVDMKDKYTNGHSLRVAQYTAMLAKELGYNDETVEKYYHIALLHDVGKIAIPRDVLNKPGKLTDEEYSIIKTHTTKGYELLKNIQIIPDLAVGAQSHHERPDGKGYPKGLKGDKMPRVAQIIAVADAFDAMYSDRPYRKRMPFKKVVSIIQEVSGTQLTPDVVEAFMRLVEKGELHPFDEDDSAE